MMNSHNSSTVSFISSAETSPKQKKRTSPSSTPCQLPRSSKKKRNSSPLQESPLMVNKSTVSALDQTFERRPSRVILMASLPVRATQSKPRSLCFLECPEIFSPRLFNLYTKDKICRRDRKSFEPRRCKTPRYHSRILGHLALEPQNSLHVTQRQRNVGDASNTNHTGIGRGPVATQQVQKAACCDGRSTLLDNVRHSRHHTGLNAMCNITVNKLIIICSKILHSHSEPHVPSFSRL